MSSNPRNEDEVTLTRPILHAGPSPRQQAPQAATPSPKFHADPLAQQGAPQQHVRAPAQQAPQQAAPQAPRPNASSPAAPPQQQYVAAAPAPRFSASDTAAIPQTQNPIDMNVLLEGMNVTMTIGKGNVIDGSASVGEGECMIVRGTVRGNIICPGMLIVAETGVIEGDIHAGQCWIEGEIASSGHEMTRIDAAILHLGVGSKVTANCTYDQLSISTPNRGIRGNMNLRDSTNPRRG